MPSCVSVGCLRGQKGQWITKDPPQQHSVSFSEASEGGYLTPCDIILPTYNRRTLSAAIFKSFQIGSYFADMPSMFTIQRNVHTFRDVCAACHSVIEIIAAILPQRKLQVMLFCFSSLCVSSQRLRCNTYNPQLKRCWVSTWPLWATVTRLFSSIIHIRLHLISLGG